QTNKPRASGVFFACVMLPAMSTLVTHAHAYAVLAFTAIAFFLFTRESIPIPVTSLLIVVALAVGFHLFPYNGAEGAITAREIFSGCGPEALVALCSLMVLGRALMVTGALESIASVRARVWACNRHGVLFALLA